MQKKKKIALHEIRHKTKAKLISNFFSFFFSNSSRQLWGNEEDEVVVG